MCWLKNERKTLQLQSTKGIMIKYFLGLILKVMIFPRSPSIFEKSHLIKKSQNSQKNHNILKKVGTHQKIYNLCYRYYSNLTFNLEIHDFQLLCIYIYIFVCVCLCFCVCVYACVRVRVCARACVCDILVQKKYYVSSFLKSKNFYLLTSKKTFLLLFISRFSGLSNTYFF